MEKNTKYTNKTNTELSKILSQKREELRVVRFTSAGSRPKDTSEPRKIRKEIARIMTEFSSRANTVKK